MSAQAFIDDEAMSAGAPAFLYARLHFSWLATQQRLHFIFTVFTTGMKYYYYHTPLLIQSGFTTATLHAAFDMMTICALSRYLSDDASAALPPHADGLYAQPAA